MKINGFSSIINSIQQRMWFVSVVLILLYVRGGASIGCKVRGKPPGLSLLPIGFNKPLLYEDVQKNYKNGLSDVSFQCEVGTGDGFAFSIDFDVISRDALLNLEISKANTNSGSTEELNAPVLSKVLDVNNRWITWMDDGTVALLDENVVATKRQYIVKLSFCKGTHPGSMDMFNKVKLLFSDIWPYKPFQDSEDLRAELITRPKLINTGGNIANIIDGVYGYLAVRVNSTDYDIMDDLGTTNKGTFTLLLDKDRVYRTECDDTHVHIYQCINYLPPVPQPDGYPKFCHEMFEANLEANARKNSAVRDSTGMESSSSPLLQLLVPPLSEGRTATDIFLVFDIEDAKCRMAEADLTLFRHSSINSRLESTIHDGVYERFILEFQNPVFAVVSSESAVIGSVDLGGTLGPPSQNGEFSALSSFWEPMLASGAFSVFLSKYEIVLCARYWNDGGYKGDVIFEFDVDKTTRYKTMAPFYKNRLRHNKQTCFNTHTNADNTTPTSSYGVVASFRREDGGELPTSKFELSSFVSATASDEYQGINVILLPNGGDSEFVLNSSFKERSVLLSTLLVQRNDNQDLSKSGSYSEAGTNASFDYFVTRFLSGTDLHGVPIPEEEETEKASEEEELIQCKGLCMTKELSNSTHIHIDGKTKTASESGVKGLVIGLNSSRFTVINSDKLYSDSLGEDKVVNGYLDLFVVAVQQEKPAEFEIMSHDTGLYVCVSKLNPFPCIPIVSHDNIKACRNRCGPLDNETHMFSCPDENVEMSPSINTYFCMIDAGRNVTLSSNWIGNVISFFSTQVNLRAKQEKGFTVKMGDGDTKARYPIEEVGSITFSRDGLKWNTLAVVNSTMTYSVYSLAEGEGGDTVWAFLDKGRKLGNSNCKEKKCSFKLDSQEKGRRIAVVAADLAKNYPILYDPKVYEPGLPIALVVTIVVIILAFVGGLVALVILVHRYVKNKSFMKAMNKIEEDMDMITQADTAGFSETSMQRGTVRKLGDTDEEEEEEEGSGSEYDEYEEDGDGDGEEDDYDDVDEFEDEDGMLE